MTNLTRDRDEALTFVADHLNELRQLSAAHRIDVLSYLLEMAYLEASDLIRQERPYDRMRSPRRERNESVS